MPVGPSVRSALYSPPSTGLCFFSFLFIKQRLVGHLGSRGDISARYRFPSVNGEMNTLSVKGRARHKAGSRGAHGQNAQETQGPAPSPAGAERWLYKPRGGCA